MNKLIVKQILMDVDGTMTCSCAEQSMEKSPFRHLVGLVAEKKHISFETAEYLIRRCGDIENRCLSEFLPELKIDAEEYFNILKEDLARHITIPDDTVFFLKTMLERGIPVCSATTNSRFMTLAKLAVAGLADFRGTPYLVKFHSGNEFNDPRGKFSENYFPNILKHHRYAPETLMMIGDEPRRDLVPALEAGIRYGVIIDRKQTEDICCHSGGIFVRSLEYLAEMII